MAYEFTRKKLGAKRRALSVQVGVASLAFGLVVWGLGSRFAPDTAFGAFQTAIYAMLTATAAFFCAAWVIDQTTEANETVGADMAGLKAANSNLSALVDEQHRLLLDVEDLCGRDGHGGQLEDGESEIIDRVRAHLSTLATPSERRTVFLSAEEAFEVRQVIAGELERCHHGLGADYLASLPEVKARAAHSMAVLTRVLDRLA